MRKDLSLKLIFISLAFLAGAQGSFSQARPENPIAPYQGIYRFESGELILISRGGVIDEVARPYFLDWQTGRHGTLTAKDEGVFVSTTAPAAKSNVPVDTEILFRRDEDGKIESLVIRDSGYAERKAVRVVLYEDEDTSFMNGDVKLAATLRRPKVEGPVPAIVLVHGSGPGDRAQMNDMNSFLASLGLAVLTYDKRGCGASGGDWKKVDIDVLAQDALAGVRWLKAQPGIDPLRVGLYGFSQGGWITPLAASLSKEPGFVINSSGPATSMRRQDTFSMANELRYSGFNEEEIGLIITGLNLLIDFAQGKATPAELDEFMDRSGARTNPKFKNFALPPAKYISADALYAQDQNKIGDMAWFFHLNPDHDGLAPYRKISCPTLVTYGGLDYLVPVEESVRLLAGVIAESGRRNLKVEVIPGCGHGYGMVQEKAPMNPAMPRTVSLAYYVTIKEWLMDNGIVK